MIQVDAKVGFLHSNLHYFRFVSSPMGINRHCYGTISQREFIGILKACFSISAQEAHREEVIQCNESNDSLLFKAFSGFFLLLSLGSYTLLEQIKKKREVITFSFSFHFQFFINFKQQNSIFMMTETV